MNTDYNSMCNAAECLTQIEVCLFALPLDLIASLDKDAGGWVFIKELYNLFMIWW